MFFRRFTWLAAVALIGLSLGNASLARPAHAQNEQCFAQTNQCISGRFLRFWLENGGLSIFGYPITPAREERNPDTGATYLTQWFERNRFEYHPENNAPYDVLLGRLGADRLASMGRNWQGEGRESGAKAGCLWFPQTGHNVCDQAPGVDSAQAGFMSYWRYEGLGDGRLDAYGRSLAMHGLPLTEARMETNSSGDTVLTQWFERGRFEWHPNNPPGFRVLLGLLGNELKGGATPAPAPPTTPVVTYVDRDGAVYEWQPGDRIQRIGTLPAMGRVLDAVRVGNRLVVLHEQGLQSLTLGGQLTTIATFTKGDALHGSLMVPGGGNKIMYTYARRSDSPMGFTGIIGVIEDGVARKIHEAPNQMSTLGLTKDESNMYVINWGGDPGISAVQVFSIENGAFQSQFPVEGYASAALSPDRNTLAMVSLPYPYPDSLMFYDLNNRTAPARKVDLPRRGWSGAQLIWSRDNRVIYALAYPSSGTGELYRIDPAQKKAELVASNIAIDARLHSVSDDGRWMLAEMQQRAVVIDLKSGATQTQALPTGAVIAHWR